MYAGIYPKFLEKNFFNFFMKKGFIQTMALENLNLFVYWFEIESSEIFDDNVNSGKFPQNFAKLVSLQRFLLKYGVSYSKVHMMIKRKVTLG